MNAKVNLNDTKKLEHAISILELIAQFADNIDHYCDEAQFNLTGSPNDLKEREMAYRSAFAARALAKQVGYMVDTALKALGGEPSKACPEKWISDALLDVTSFNEEGAA